jgi:hypothetical protein
MDEHGLTLGKFNFALESLNFHCVHKSHAWIRSYDIDVQSTKRCPKQGSCRGNFCNLVRPDTMITELKEVNSYPGISRCVDSSGLWLMNGCGFPTASCLFYRFYAKQSTH